MYRKVLNTESLIEVRYAFRNCVDYMRDFIADNELDVLDR